VWILSLLSRVPIKVFQITLSGRILSTNVSFLIISYLIVCKSSTNTIITHQQTNKQKMSDGLAKWDEKGRWDTIWLAGLRDDEPNSLFDKILAGEIPASIVKEDDKILAFKDINPAAPAHVLVIPKDRDGLTRLSKSTPEHYEILGRLMVAAGEIAKDESLGFGDGARIVINDGAKAGQEVFHLHGTCVSLDLSLSLSLRHQYGRFFILLFCS
jgi:diadenosine tetraphosphate (Ap4A) HIT family hydrolase